MLRRTEFVMTWPMMHSPNLCGAKTTSVLQVKTNRSCVTQTMFFCSKGHATLITNTYSLKKVSQYFLELD